MKDLRNTVLPREDANRTGVGVEMKLVAKVFKIYLTWILLGQFKGQTPLTTFIAHTKRMYIKTYKNGLRLNWWWGRNNIYKKWILYKCSYPLKTLWLRVKWSCLVERTCGYSWICGYRFRLNIVCGLQTKISRCIVGWKRLYYFLSSYD